LPKKPSTSNNKLKILENFFSFNLSGDYGKILGSGVAFDEGVGLGVAFFVICARGGVLGVALVLIGWVGLTFLLIEF
jgi:hypothetical protein